MKKLFLFLLVCSYHIVMAQQKPDYFVYLVTGTVTTNKAATRPQAVKQKQFLYNDELLTLGKGAEVTLVNQDAKYLVLNTPGVYKVRDITNKTLNSYPSVIKSYVTLLWNEMLDPDHDYTKFKSKNVGSIRGGVSRGACDNMIFPVNGLKTSDHELHFAWQQTSPQNQYTLSIFDEKGSVITTIPVKDTQQVVNVQQVLNGKPGKYNWLIKGENGSCEDEEPLSFEIISKDEEEKITAPILSGISSNDRLRQLQAVHQLERKALIGAASRYYASLVDANPEDEVLRKSYVLFLLKYGFDNEANHVWMAETVKK